MNPGGITKAVRKPERLHPFAIASEELLRRCIRYGLRHNRDLGMGREAFMARARQLGLVR